MSGQTMSMTAQTESMVMRQRALATRSLTAANRLSGPAQIEAMQEHFERFVPSVNRSCPARR